MTSVSTYVIVVMIQVVLMFSLYAVCEAIARLKTPRHYVTLNLLCAVLVGAVLYFLMR